MSAVKTHVHIRLSQKTAQAFVSRLTELGFSPIPNEKNSYYMMKGKSRLLLQEETSGDTLITAFSEEPGGELVGILEPTAKRFAGDFSFEGGGDTIHVRGGQDVDASAIQQAAPQQQPKLNMQQMQQQAAQAPSNVNMDPAYYGRMAMNAMSNIMNMLALQSYDLEKMLVQTARLTSAVSIAGQLEAGIIDDQGVQQETVSAKRNVQDVPTMVAQMKQDWGVRQAAAQSSAGFTMPSGSQPLNDKDGNTIGYLDENGAAVMFPDPTHPLGGSLDVDEDEGEEDPFAV